MRHVLSGVFLTGATLMALTGCSGEGGKPYPDLPGAGRPNILSTTAMIEDIVKRVGQEKITSVCLMRGDVDPHSYEFVKGDDEKLADADVIFHNGVGLECGASVRYYLENEEKAVSLGDSVRARFPERLIKVDGIVDPHIWMDPDLFSEIVDPIVATLTEIDPDNGPFYRKNGLRVKESLKEVDRACFVKLRNIPRDKKYLVTTHDALRYFVRRYFASEETGGGWEERFASPNGLAPDGRTSVGDMRRTVDFLIKNRVSVIFGEANLGTQALRKIIAICKKKGHTVSLASTPLYGDTLNEEEGYIRMIEHNVDAIVSHVVERDEGTGTEG
ncbi:MAG: zinc ABC transporter substrate-binding protein [Simkaniaceae bacterium]|nr:zinc ABC transporter substrate-binding protein [Simkaniaceae bacterium]